MVSITQMITIKQCCDEKRTFFFIFVHSVDRPKAITLQYNSWTICVDSKLFKCVRIQINNDIAI